MASETSTRSPAWASRATPAALSFGLALLLASAAQAAQPKTTGCLIEPSAVAEVGSPVTGVIDRLQVNLGDRVESGQVLAWLRSDVERANAEVADTRAQIDADVQAAAATLDLAQQKAARQDQLVKQNFVSQQAADQAHAEAQVAAQKLRLARSQQSIWVRERAAAQAQVSLRTLRSPISGVIVERYINPGERVEERPVLRVATIDPLRVDLMVPAAQWGAVAVGDQVSIKPELPHADVARARVSYVDQVMDAASNTFRVRLTLANPGNRLPAGLRCKADLASVTKATALERQAEPRALHRVASDAALVLVMAQAPASAGPLPVQGGAKHPGQRKGKHKEKHKDKHQDRIKDPRKPKRAHRHPHPSVRPLHPRT